MSHKIQVACAACGIAFAALFIVGLWFIAGFVPPHAPLMGAQELAERYSHNTGAIRFGIMLLMISAGLLLPFAAVIGVQIRRIEGEFPVLAFTELAAGTLTAVIVLVPSVLWTAVAFRPERNPELLLLLNDFAWLFLLMTFAPISVQLVSIGLAVLSDKRKIPAFARWVGYFNFWVAVLLMPGGLITFFKAGPFAWNGLLAFWVPLIAFAGWFVVMFFALLAAIRKSPVEA